MAGIYDYFRGNNRGTIDQMDAEFAARFVAMMAAAPPSVRSQVSIGNSFRSYDEQARLYDRWQRRVPGQAQAAPPGKSNHNHGLAADLQYGSNTAKSWVHTNAARFGLRFPMAHEPWHIEPVEVKDGWDGSGRTVSGAGHGGHGGPEGWTGDPVTGDMPVVDNHDPMTQMERLFAMIESGSSQYRVRPLKSPAKVVQEQLGQQFGYDTTVGGLSMLEPLEVRRGQPV